MKEWKREPNYWPSFLGKPGSVVFRVAGRMVIECARGKGGKSDLCLNDWPLGGPTSYADPEEVSGGGKGIAGEGKEAEREGEGVGEKAETSAGEAQVTASDDLTFPDYEKAMKRIYMIGDEPRSDILGKRPQERARHRVDQYPRQVGRVQERTRPRRAEGHSRRRLRCRRLGPGERAKDREQRTLGGRAIPHCGR